MLPKISSFVCISLVVVGSLAAQTKSATPPPSVTSDAAAPTKVDPAKEADIRRLMQVTQADVLVTKVMDNMQNTLRPMLVQSLPPGEYRSKLIDLFIEKFRARANAKQILDLAIPHYDKYFTDEEIKTLISFYETPVGKKAAATMPQLTTELQLEGSAWGEKMGRESMQEVLAEHPDLREALENAAAKGKLPQP